MTSQHPADLIPQETDLVEAGLTLQHQGLQLLFAEMRALAALMPGNPSASAIHPGGNHRPDASTDAEIEAGFDNMPV